MKALITEKLVFWMAEKFMCEFNVILNGKTQLKDVIYVKVQGDNVTVKNILGEAKEFKDCKIVEIDVPNTRLVLASTKQ